LSVDVVSSMIAAYMNEKYSMMQYLE